MTDKSYSMLKIISSVLGLSSFSSNFISARFFAMNWKFCFLLVAFLVFVSSTETSLQKDLEEIESAIPKSRIKVKLLKYYVFEHEVREFAGYLSGTEFTKLKREFSRLNAVENFFKYLEQNGVNIHSE